ncbi:MAG: LD-carboxypeptidase [Bacilli bacterium]|nr:LD-carboxypeptidase [Bacilli bacterium]
MRQPPFLREGSSISLVAPSFGCATEPYATRLDVSIKHLKRLGYRVEEGPNARLAVGVAGSNVPELRGQEINDAFASDADLILSVGGGETMCETLPYVDFEAIKRGKPKWFMGFSDNTNLTFTLATLADTMTVYGPCAPSFFEKKLRHAQKDALDMLRGETHFEGYPKWSLGGSNKEHPLWGYRANRPKIITPHGYEKPFEGLMLGGCLDCLALLCGTRFDRTKEFIAAHPEGIVWFLEACDLNPLALRRSYFQLKEAGWLDNAKGFLLGRPYSAQEEFLGVDRFSAAIDILGPLGVPLLIDVDLGHLPPSMPIKTGAHARVGFEKGNLIVDYLE